MELQEAVERAMKDPKVTSLRDYFIASVFSITDENKDIKSLTFLFYNPEGKKVRDCIVDGSSVDLGEEQQAQKEMSPISVEAAKISIGEALGIARKHYSKKIINILVTLHMKEKLLWTITMIGADITATSYDIDAVDGQLLHEETTSLMKRL